MWVLQLYSLRLLWWIDVLWNAIGVLGLTFPFLQNGHWGFEKDNIEPIDHSGSNATVTILGLLIHRHRMCFHSFLSSLIPCYYIFGDFLGGSEVTVSAWNVEDLGSVPGLGRSPGEGNGIPLQYSCLGKSRNRGAWQSRVHGVTKSQT